MKRGVISFTATLLLPILMLVNFLNASVSYINEYDTEILFNGSSLSTDTSIISIEGNLFVPLQDICQKLALNVKYINRQRKFIVNRQADRKTISFRLNSEKILIDQEEDLMNYPVYHIKNRAYVSLSDFVWLFGYYLEKKDKNSFFIVSRLDRIVWENQKLIISSKTPLNAEVEFFNNSYIVTVPNAIWSNPQQLPVIEVNDGIVKTIEIKNSVKQKSDVLITIKVSKKISYIIFPEEKAVIISFLYDKPAPKPSNIKETLNIETKESSPKEQKPKTGIPASIASQTQKDETKSDDHQAAFVFNEDNIIRQGYSFVIKLPKEPDSILTLENPKRLVIDFEGMATSDPLSITGRPYLPLIKEIRLAQFSADPAVVRLVIELSKQYKEFNQFGKNLKLYHLSKSKALEDSVLDTKKETSTQKPVAEDEPETETPDVSNIKELDHSKKTTFSTPKPEPQQTAVEEVETDSKQTEKKQEISHKPGKRYQFQKVLNGKRILIDAGHGGRDPGAISRNGLKEKDLVLQVAKLIAEKVKAAGGVPIMVRESDRFVSLEDRADLAIKKKADLLISLHFNSFHKQKISGAESYYYKPKDYALTKAVHNQITRISKIKNNGIKQSQMYILNHTHIPGVLVEPAYMSNLKEEKLIQDKEFQQELSDAVVIGVINYLKNR